MPASRFLRCGMSASLSLILIGCEAVTEPTDHTAPPASATAAEDSLWILRFTADAPPLSDTVVSFWAVKGDNREVEIHYLPTENYGGGRYLYFRVPGNALLKSPEGREYQGGDSVRITIRIVKSTQFSFEFSPAGLQFDPDKPAELRVYYDWMDGDINGDGKVDEADARLYEQFGFWRQERVGERWHTLVTMRDQSVKRARADIRGFTRYALASN